ncbi:hypothetical protein COCMIDRAFT_109095, partial [Bipolaris oryzae ATCC 44560]
LIGIMNPSFDLFSTLPDELLLLIFEQIKAGDNILSFHALNTTSKRLRRLTTDYLYYRFHGLAPEQLLRTIALPCPNVRPELANHIKEVVWYQNYWTGTDVQRCLKQDDRILLADKLQSSGRLVHTTRSSGNLPERFVNFHDTCEKHWWYLEFFLFFTPKVQRLHVWDTWQWDDHSYWFETMVQNPSEFENLHSVTLQGPLRLENAVPLLTLPSIRKLELTEVIAMRQEPDRIFSWQDGWERRIEEMLRSGSSLEQLVMTESDVFFLEAIIILEKLNNLKSLSYEHAPSDLGSHPETYREFLLIDELRRLSGIPLKHLRIRGEVPLDESVVSSLLNVKAPMLEKHPLQHLHTLDIGPCDKSSINGISLMMYENDSDPSHSGIAELLPDTLEVLNIKLEPFGYDRLALISPYSQILADFAAAVACSPCNLKRVTLVEWPAWRDEDSAQATFSILQGLYREAGMELDISFMDI